MLSHIQKNKIISFLSQTNQNQKVSLKETVANNLAMYYFSLLPNRSEYYAYQQRILQSALANRFTLVLHGRQVGITETSYMTATVAALQRPHKRILFLVPTQGMLHLQYRQLVEKLRDINVSIETCGMEIIRFENGSEIHFLNMFKFMVKPSRYCGYDNVILQEATLSKNFRELIEGVGAGIKHDTKILCCSGLYSNDENNKYMKELWEMSVAIKYYIPSFLSPQYTELLQRYQQPNLKQELEAKWPEEKTS